jgi:hypothetical protein
MSKPKKEDDDDQIIVRQGHFTEKKFKQKTKCLLPLSYLAQKMKIQLTLLNHNVEAT